MSTVNASVRLSLDTLETYSTAEVPMTDSGVSFQYNAADLVTTLDANSTPPATKVFTLYATGPQSLDLTNLTNALNDPMDCTGLRVQAIILTNESATDPVTISDAAANPYSLNATNDKVIQPGGTYAEYFADQLADISATEKAIDITAAAGESFYLLILFG